MRIVGFFMVIAFVLWAKLGMRVPISIFEPWALLIVCGTTFGGFLMAAGNRTGNAIRVTFSKATTQKDLGIGILAFKTARYAALAGGALSFVIALIVMLADLDTLAKISSFMISGLAGVFAGIFVSYFLLLPIQIKMEHRLMEAGGPAVTSPDTVLDLIVMAGGIIFIGIAFALLLYTFSTQG